jgi:hypothetical protein
MDLGMIAILVTILWLGSLGLYLYVSRQQSDLQADIENLQKLLDTHDKEP